MHSSRMRTARFNGQLYGEGGICPGGVSWGCLPGGWVCPGGFLLGVSSQAGFPLGLENLEKWEGIFQSGKSQEILNRLDKSGKSQG